MEQFFGKKLASVGPEVTDTSLRPIRLPPMSCLFGIAPTAEAVGSMGERAASVDFSELARRILEDLVETC